MLIRARNRSALHRRKCVACGYAGVFLERPGQSSCPRCACDFVQRPPRSYAEMEGIEESEVSRRRLTHLDADPIAREWRLVARWAAFLTGVALLGFSILALALAAFVIR